MSTNTKPAVGSSKHKRVTGSGQPSCRDQNTTGAPGRQDTDRVPLYTADGRVCGVLVGGELIKTISGSIHMLRTPRAIALDLGAVQAADAQGVSQIFISDRETGTVYRSTITELYRHGWKFDRGWGWQIAMRLERFRRDSDQVKAIESSAAERPQAAALQLALL